jgi:hypothetical protein
MSYTDEEVEKFEELNEIIKRPDRYYRITINGYGGESSYMSISKEAHDFWKSVKEEHGDGDLVHYMVSAEDEEFDFDDIDEVPENAMFMTDEDGDPRPWYEPPNEIEHTYGVSYDSAWIEVDELDGDEYGSAVIETIVEHTEVTALVDQVYEESGDDAIEINEYSCCEEPEEDVKYMAQMYSSEKGTFFDGVVHLTGGEKFDPRKLKIYVVEFLNGEDTITSVEYNGVEVDNNGGDTNGKGYYADVWEV